MKELLENDVVELLEYRIQQEELSARLYSQMSMWLKDNGYGNLSKLYTEYSEEEMEHAQWSKDYLLSYGHIPKLSSLIAPESDFTCCEDILIKSLDHELEIESQCKELAKKGLDSNNPSLHSLGVKYCNEQVDEIDKTMELIDVFKLTSDMLLFDNYVKKYLD